MKYIIGGLVVIFAIGAVVFSSLKSEDMVAYYKVSEVFAAPEMPTGNFRINGNVVEGSIEKADLDRVSFQMAEGEKTVNVHYEGAIPDTFKDGSEVVVEGSFDQGQVFQAHTLLAKCPSKYEAEDPDPENMTTGTKGI